MIYANTFTISYLTNIRCEKKNLHLSIDSRWRESKIRRLLLYLSQWLVESYSKNCVFSMKPWHHYWRKHGAKMLCVYEYAPKVTWIYTSSSFRIPWPMFSDGNDVKSFSGNVWVSFFYSFILYTGANLSSSERTFTPNSNDSDRHKHTKTKNKQNEAGSCVDLYVLDKSRSRQSEKCLSGCVRHQIVII